MFVKDLIEALQTLIIYNPSIQTKEVVIVGKDEEYNDVSVDVLGLENCEECNQLKIILSRKIVVEPEILDF